MKITETLSRRIFSSNSRIFIFLFFFVTGILFFVSPDSYTHDLYGRCDSAYFYMSGKAMMNGLVPYVDFTDSKGPLLWLIYGIGYLLHRTSYVGVFWLSALTYAVTFFLCYKTARLLTGEKMKSIGVAMSMVLPYFLIWFHYEIRAEDFCHPLIMASLYNVIKFSAAPDKQTLKRAGWIMGSSLVACVMIKWSIAVMYLAGIGLMLYLAYRQKHCCYFVKTFVGATLAALLPFLIYFGIQGNGEAFIQEYFINTSKTVQLSLSGLFKEYTMEWVSTLTTNRVIYLAYLAGIFAIFKKQREMAYGLGLVFLVFMGISIHHEIAYYTTILASFALFVMIWLVNQLHRYSAIAFIGITGIYLARAVFEMPNLFYQASARAPYYEAAYVMAQVKSPKLINEGYEIGLGMPAHTLPATKYWSRQNGETEAMRLSRLEAIRQHQADFVTYQMMDEEKNKTFEKILAEAGYVYYCSFNDVKKTYRLYGSPGLKMPDADFQVSNADILLKREIFN